tara:strand:+ start:6371 stop:7507 length:1137 start_codon:yes stop_codon:yes gene_type:complete
MASLLKITLFIGLNFCLNFVSAGDDHLGKSAAESLLVPKSYVLNEFPLINSLNRDVRIKSKADHYKEISKLIGSDAKVKSPEDEGFIDNNLNSEWQEFRHVVMQKLNEEIFNEWPKSKNNLTIQENYHNDSKDVQFSVIKFSIEKFIRFPLYLVHRKDVNLEDLDLVVLNILDENGWPEFVSTYGKIFPKAFDSNVDINTHEKESFESNQRMFQNQDWGMAYFSPRGVGAMAKMYGSLSKEEISKRYNLFDKSLEGMQVFDIIQSVNALRLIEGMKNVPLWMQSHDEMSANLLYASLYIKNLKRLDLHGLPESHNQGPAYIGIMNYIDLPQCLALVVERTRVVLYQPDADYNPFAKNVIEALNFNNKSLAVRKTLNFE